jgi:glycosyltransferase involved in cell wall biosynthesis
LKRIVIFASCDSFEGFYGGTFGLDRETFLKNYRNDFIWEYAEGLRSAGHEVYLYILSYGPAAETRTFDGFNVRFLRLPPWLRIPDAILFRLRNVSYAPQLRDRIAFLAYGNSLKRALHEDRIDVLYNQELWTPRFDILIRHLTVDIIGADHGAVYADWMEGSKRRSLKRAAKLVCQSKSGLERALAFGGDAVLMYNGVNTSFFTPPATGAYRSQTVLSVGRFVEPQKRFSDLLHALQMLPGFTLNLVGSGPDETMLKELANTLGISDRVCFTGFISSRTELRRLYQDCGVFVSTSAWEAVALVMLEAMSCCAPVVATNIPSFEELLTDGKDGILVPVGAPKAVANAILRAFEQRQALGANARSKVEQGYSSEVLYRKLSELIESV